MCNIKNNPENIATHRGLYRVWLETCDRGTPRLVSVWIDPVMRAFEPQAALDTALTESLAISSEDEPPSWVTAGDNRTLVRIRRMTGENFGAIAFAPLQQAKTTGKSFT